MIEAVADTHAAVWYLFDNPKLSANARQAIERAFRTGNQIGVSSISLAEMIYLAEKGRIPTTAVQDLIHSLLDPGYPLHELPVDASVAEQMALVSRDDVPDMPDRIIAATGLRYGVPVKELGKLLSTAGTRCLHSQKEWRRKDFGCAYRGRSRGAGGRQAGN